ncbi:MAG: hypothetical protein R3301_17420, partial [Saprospiraceae bacterium]|nr:hypothetical protein [Saprospiraceae bacterium]
MKSLFLACALIASVSTFAQRPSQPPIRSANPTGLPLFFTDVSTPTENGVGLTLGHPFSTGARPTITWFAPCPPLDPLGRLLFSPTGDYDYLTLSNFGVPGDDGMAFELHDAFSVHPSGLIIWHVANDNAPPLERADFRLYPGNDSGLRISNIGSSGEDGVRAELVPPGGPITARPALGMYGSTAPEGLQVRVEFGENEGELRIRPTDAPAFQGIRTEALLPPELTGPKPRIELAMPDDPAPGQGIVYLGPNEGLTGLRVAASDGGCGPGVSLGIANDDLTIHNDAPQIELLLPGQALIRPNPGKPAMLFTNTGATGDDGVSISRYLASCFTRPAISMRKGPSAYGPDVARFEFSLSEDDLELDVRTIQQSQFQAISFDMRNPLDPAGPAPSIRLAES